MNSKEITKFKIRPIRLTLSICLFLFLPFFAISQNNWIIDLPSLGTFSSPRTADLNKDGVKDIIMGAGRLEFQACDSAVIAIDGKNGKLLWKVSAKDQIFGSAVFKDVTDDGVEDIFIGGRSAELTGINGANGKVLWRFKKVNKKSKLKLFNFYNPQLISDQDGDGLQDLLVSNGGDVFVEPHDPNRPPGYLMIVSSKTGKLLSSATMPDGKETYLSPVVLNSKEDSKTEVLFGSGGETVGGGLYITTLDNVVKGDLSSAICLDSSANKGYIGPPVRVDINRDGILDIISNSVNGRLLAFDGKTHKRIWEVEIPNTESYSSINLGYFNQDDIPDIFVSFGRGVWPNLTWSDQIMVDGSTGNIEFRDSLGFYQNTTPLAVDVTGDGIDEVIMSLNFQEVNKFHQKFFYNSLIVIEFRSGDMLQITENIEGSNLSSTPWIGDLDDNGFLDIIYCHSTNLRETYNFSGMKVRRMDTQIPIFKKIKWGAYQGSNYDGIFIDTKEIVGKNSSE